MHYRHFRISRITSITYDSLQISIIIFYSSPYFFYTYLPIPLLALPIFPFPPYLSDHVYLVITLSVTPSHISITAVAPFFVLGFCMHCRVFTYI